MATTGPTPSPTNAPARVAETPGRTLGIVGLIIGFVITPLLGLILCIIARQQSTKAGVENQPAFIGMWIHGVLTALAVIGIVLVVVISLLSSNN